MHDSPKSEGAAVSDTTSVEFDDLDMATVNNIVENFRIDGPDGEITLSEIMIDLMEAHNQLEKYKQGSLSLHQRLDERITEEKQQDTDEDIITILEEIKQSAFGVYLRLQRGDEELKGERDGKYSDFFDQ